MTSDDAAGLTGLLVGYGSIGRRHLTNLHSLGVGDWAVVHTGSGTLPFEPPCPVRRYADLAAALEAETPSFAVVANPTALHLPTALACAAGGCDLLLEKPVSDTVDGLDELRREVDHRGVKVLVGFQFRFDRGLRRVAELLAGGTLGVALHARVVWGEHLPGWHPWEDWRTSYAARRDLGGGVHHTLSHPLDYLRMLFGEATVLTAVLTTDAALGLDVAEAADVTLGFGAVTASVHLDYWSRPPVHRVEVVCSEGTLTWDHHSGVVGVWDAAGAGWRTEQFPGAEGRDGLFVAEARHLLDVVSRRAEPVCTLDDGVSAARVCAAIEAAAARAAAPGTEAR